MSNCWVCGDDMTSSYFLRITTLKPNKKEYLVGKIVESCPECHHHFIYDPEDILKDYILRKNINMRGYKIGR